MYGDRMRYRERIKESIASRNGEFSQADQLHLQELDVFIAHVNKWVREDAMTPEEARRLHAILIAYLYGRFESAEEDKEEKEITNENDISPVENVDQSLRNMGISREMFKSPTTHFNALSHLFRLSERGTRNVHYQELADALHIEEKANARRAIATYMSNIRSALKENFGEYPPIHIPKGQQGEYSVEIKQLHQGKLGEVQAALQSFEATIHEAKKVTDLFEELLNKPAEQAAITEKERQKHFQFLVESLNFEPSGAAYAVLEEFFRHPTLTVSQNRIKELNTAFQKKSTESDDENQKKSQGSAKAGLHRMRKKIKEKNLPYELREERNDEGHIVAHTLHTAQPDPLAILSEMRSRAFAIMEQAKLFLARTEDL